MEIRQVYDRSRATHGHSFEMGDGPAHSSLARTLLVLNTGLINLLNNALHRDPETKASSRRTLYNLSETAALDTLSALYQLNSRLSMNIPSMPVSRQDRQPSAKRHRRHRQQQQPLPPPESVSSSSKQNPPPPYSLLAHGGEVRSKNGSSVVSAAEARKLRRDVDSHHMSRSKSPLPNDSASQVSLIIERTRISSKSRKGDAGTQQGAHTNNDRNPRRISSQSDESWQAEREPSILFMSNAWFEEQPLRHPVHVGPPKSSSDPQSRPMSTATFLSASTKIGEIPEHRRSDRNKPLDRQTPRRMPRPIPPPLDPQLSITKASRFKFWERP